MAFPPRPFFQGAAVAILFAALFGGRGHKGSEYAGDKDKGEQAAPSDLFHSVFQLGEA
jgi:hypothetical protein